MRKTFVLSLAAAGLLSVACSAEQQQGIEARASQGASALPSVFDSANARASELMSQGADVAASASARASELRASAEAKASELRDQASAAASDLASAAASASGAAGQAIEDLKIKLTENRDQAQQELERLRQAGVYDPNKVEYSDDPVTALKQVKERLEQGLVDLQGNLTEKGRQELGGS
ncbi:hypothetical protein [Nonomuraea soli]|uniref:Putative phage infection (PIP) family protein YhgE n=1 Tax=Nonomuraea soli TaxID=1032476 RepID=A0A7W0CPF0_9ACTN|nr:hypothetical protein [Nonomuraea soli]MBA2894779.1 putative phage infection (PIP) family protein YhgE [Nonomuraea soli]